MEFLCIFALLLVAAIASYIGIVLHKKGIHIRDVRVRSVHDAKKLFSYPMTNSLKYLNKVA